MATRDAYFLSTFLHSTTTLILPMNPTHPLNFLGFKLLA